MKKIIFLSSLLLPGLTIFYSEPVNTPEMHTKNEKLTLTILYDNYVFNKNLKNSWGFSCLIEGLDKTILFDTGNDDGIMLSNMAALGKDPADVDVVVLSHIHADHTGGLMGFLEKNHEVTVYLPVSFPEQFKKNVTASGARMVEVTGPVKILDEVSTTGEMGTEIIEQSLMITSPNGSIILTGCAHPGIQNIVARSKELGVKDILLVMGGFHLLRTPVDTVRDIAKSFQQMNVKYVAPTHCSGDGTIKEFKAVFGDHCLAAGAGKVIVVDEL
jgi:7,8-dihydropterin-6-yl-methyl-4-(beta-D-ribofuranosyl)aminobenzene 5'-phosphate synthase